MIKRSVTLPLHINYLAKRASNHTGSFSFSILLGGQQQPFGNRKYLLKTSEA
nr:hypothetical protein [Brevibacillus laterosporus]